MDIDSCKLLKETINNLKDKKADYQETAVELFKFDYEAFDKIFNINNIKVEPGTYKRVPVFSDDNCCAMLMLWGSRNQTAIHDHLDYNGLIKVLKGALTEVSYLEDNDFIKFDRESDAPEGAVFPEDLGGIHSVINKLDELSVSLHVYHTPQTSLKGVRIFDLEKKKVAYLNESATSCSWKLPKENYDKIVELN